MYGQSPDYGEFQGRDLGIDSELRQVDEQIYANFHNPPWKTLTHHLFLVGIPKKLFRHLKIVAVDDKEDEFKQERMLCRVAKIPIASALSESV